MTCSQMPPWEISATIKSHVWLCASHRGWGDIFALALEVVTDDKRYLILTPDELLRLSCINKPTFCWCRNRLLEGIDTDSDTDWIHL